MSNGSLGSHTDNASAIISGGGCLPSTRDQAISRRAGCGGGRSRARLSDAEPLAGGVELSKSGSNEAAASRAARPWQVLPLAACTPRALVRTAQKLAQYLRDHPEASLADLAYTLQFGHTAFNQRRVLVARDAADALAVLNGSDPQRLLGGRAAKTAQPVVFLFPGPGAQHVGMAAGLYANEPVFRRWLDRCCELLTPHLGLDLRTLLYPADERRTTNDEGTTGIDRTPDVSTRDLCPSSSVLRSRARARQLEQTEYAQPALFAVEYALAQLWLSWGVVPAALLGHSLGEYVAATLAGVFTLEDALALVADRGRLMQALPSGTMLAVALTEAELLPLLGSDLALAAVNGPQSCVLSGPAESVAALSVLLQGRGVQCRRLHTSHAFHSQMMEPIIEPFAARVAQVALKAPRIPIVSNLSGTWLTDEQVTDPRYWANQLRQPVRFARGIATLLHNCERVLLEVGPGIALSTSARGCTSAAVSIASLGHPTDERPADMLALTALGQLWLNGIAVDWKRFQSGESRPWPASIG